MIRILIVMVLLLVSCNPRTGKRPGNYGGNAVWEHQFRQQDLSFRGISVVSESTVWVSGNHGSVVVTRDGGSHWEWNSLPGYEELDFRDIETFGPDSVLVMSAGSPGVILRTSNGGKSWDQVFYDDRADIFMNSMAFFNRDHGLVVGDPLDGRIFLMETRDGGDTWTILPDQQRPIPEEGEYLFAASGNCLDTWGSSSAAFVTGGTRARVWRTEDAGIHWQPIETPMKSGMPTFGIYAILRKGSYCFCVGGDYTDPDNRTGTFCSASSRCDYFTLTEIQPFGFRSCIKVMQVRNRDILVVTGMTGTDISSNGGVSWQAIDTLGFHTMDVEPGGRILFAAGSGGRISKLTF